MTLFINIGHASETKWTMSAFELITVKKSTGKAGYCPPALLKAWGLLKLIRPSVCLSVRHKNFNLANNF